MKRLTLVIIILLFVFLFPSFSTSIKSKTHPLDSEIYFLMDDLYALCGYSRPSTSRPWSNSEARLILSRIDYNQLNNTEKDIYDALDAIINKNLRWQGSDFAFSSYMDIALEAYAHTNSEDFVTDSSWVRGFEERKPLAKLSIEVSMHDYFYTYCDLQYGYGRITANDVFYGLDNDTNGYTSNKYVGSYKMDHHAHLMVWSEQYSKKYANNVLPKSALFDFVWPKRAIFSLGKDTWNIQYARDRISIGNSKVGNLLVDNHSDFNDYLSATFYSNGFKYQWVNIFLNALTTNGEDPTDDTRIFMIHTLEFRPFNNLSIIISEDVMFKIASPQVLDFSFFNPAFIWHNLNNRDMFNAIAYAEINYSPFKGFEMYGQFCLDQAQAPNEDNSQSDAWGLLAGLKYTKIIGQGIANFYVEFDYTTPLLYRRDEVDFIKCSRYFHFGSENIPNANAVNYGSNALVFEFIGFPYGGDTQVLELGFSYSTIQEFKIKTYARFIEQGYLTLFKSHNINGNNEGSANYSGKTPSGDVITRAFILSSNISYNLEKLFNWPNIMLEAQLDFIGKWDYQKSTFKYSNKKTDTQLSLSLNVRL